MADDQILVNNSNQQIPQVNPQQVHPSILNMTLGELLNNNPTAQNMVMQSMNLNQGQFQQMVNSMGNNQMMNMTIGELFKNGTMAQAMQLNPAQIQQMLTNPNGTAVPMQAVAMGKIDPSTGQMIPLNDVDMQRLQQVPGLSVPQKQSFFQKLLNFFI